MKKILTEQEEKLFKAIEGFTRRFESYITSKKRSKEKIDVNNITTMPTYEFVTLALQANSPKQVINTIEAIKKRYLFTFNLDKDALGFLDSIEGKAYGYMSFYINDIAKREKLYNLACKYFKSAISKGYVNAYIDLADLQEKFGNENSANETLRNVKDSFADIERKLGEMYFSFPHLVENAIRVLQGRRPFIEDERDVPLAIYHFQNGESESVECKLYKGLAMIIIGDSLEKKEGMKLVKDNLEEFKKKYKDIDKRLFASDVIEFKNNLDLIENTLFKINKR